MCAKFISGKCAVKCSAEEPFFHTFFLFSFFPFFLSDLMTKQFAMIGPAV